MQLGALRRQIKQCSELGTNVRVDGFVGIADCGVTGGCQRHHFGRGIVRCTSKFFAHQFEMLELFSLVIAGGGPALVEAFSSPRGVTLEVL